MIAHSAGPGNGAQSPGYPSLRTRQRPARRPARQSAVAAATADWTSTSTSPSVTSKASTRRAWSASWSVPNECSTWCRSFEILQRTGGYSGFGVANAALRMTAQAARPW